MDFPQIPPMPRPLTSGAVLKSLETMHRKLVAQARTEGKTEDWMPAWYVHLASGEKVRIRWFGREAALMRFTTPDGTFLLLAPEAVAITIEALGEDDEGFPIEFLDDPEDDLPTDDAGSEPVV